MKIKKGDLVQIIQGKDRGKKGKILQVLPKEEKVIVEGLNLMVKNVRARREKEKGQRVKYNAPLNLSNVLIVCKKCNKPRRAGYKLVGDKKIRICNKCKEEI
jgi:large subunit ribosomal protein L24